MRCTLWYHLHNLKNVKTPMEECYFKKYETLLKVTLLHECFLRFLNYTNGTKLHKTSHPHTPFKVFESPNKHRNIFINQM